MLDRILVLKALTDNGKGGGGDTSLIDSLLDKSITEISSDVTSIGDYTFASCANLKSVKLPNIITAGNSAFRGCASLESIELPNLAIIKQNFFDSCKNLKSVNLPNADTEGVTGGVDRCTSAFASCSSLEHLVLPKVTSITGYFFNGCTSLRLLDLPSVDDIRNNWTFLNCNKLIAVLLRSSQSIATLNNANAWCNTIKAGGTGYIYVPSALVEEYKAATNWSAFADQFRALEDYTVDGTITGELDESKI